MISNTLYKKRACYVMKCVIDRVVCRIVNILTSCLRNCPFSTPVFRQDLENPYPFSDLAFQAQIMLSLFRLASKPKKFFNSISNLHRKFLFLFYSFGIETINTFILSRSSLKNHTRFQTKMGKVYTRFQINTAQKPYPEKSHFRSWVVRFCLKKTISID